MPKTVLKRVAGRRPNLQLYLYYPTNIYFQNEYKNLTVMLVLSYKHTYQRCFQTGKRRRKLQQSTQMQQLTARIFVHTQDHTEKCKIS